MLVEEWASLIWPELKLDVLHALLTRNSIKFISPIKNAAGVAYE